MKKVLLVAIAAISGFTAFSQVSIGANGSVIKFFGDMSDISSPGFGLKLDYVTEKGVAYGGFNYFSPTTNELSLQGIPWDENKNSISVNATEEIKTFSLNAGIKWYFAGDYDDSYGVYGAFEVGYVALPYALNVTESYDKENYTVDYDGYTDTYSNFTIGGGIGFEKQLEPVYLFTDLKLGIPANNVDGSEVEVNITPSVIFNVGVRYQIN